VLASAVDFLRARSLAFAFTFAAASLLGGCVRAPLAEVRVDASAGGPTVPRDFLGVSLEYDLVPAYLGTDAAPNLVYRQLLANLGAGTMRIGGASEDKSCWLPSGAPPKGCTYPVTPEMTRAIFATAAAVDWTVILGVNLAANDPAAAASYVRDGVLPVAGADHLRAIEIGNEPDIYPREGLRPSSWSEAEHRAEFLAYAGAIAQVPGGAQLPFSGPADASTWLADLAAFPNGVEPTLGARLALLTVHYYATGICGDQPMSNATIENLLSPKTAGVWRAGIANSAQAAASTGQALQIDESNSIACGGGGPPIAAAFSSALWALDFLFSAAQAGARGVNLHSYGHGGYAPVHVDATAGGYAIHVRPIYYAMLLFAREAAGRALVGASVSSGAHVVAFAVAEGDGVKLFVLNEDLAAAGEVVIRSAKTLRTGDLLLLAAPSLDDLDHTQLGGAAIDPATGALSAPAHAPLAPDGDGAFHVQLPVAAAAMVTLSP